MLNKILLLIFSIALLVISGCSDDDEGTIIGQDDTTAPSAITTLATSDPTGSTVELSWLSTGDDGNIGKAREYDIRYSTSMITAQNFELATPTDSTPIPKVSGLNETFTVTGLLAQTKYYFAIKAADEEANWSEISNIDSATTLISGTWQQLNMGNTDLPSNWINDILINGADIYYGTNFGLAHFDGSDWTIYQHDDTDTTSIIGDDISCLAMGTDGVLWIGTTDGLSRLEDTIFTNYTDSTSDLTTNGIKALAVLGNSEKVWVGTGSKGLFLFENDLWTNYNSSNSNLAQNSVASLALDDLDHLWIGLNFGGAAYFDGSSFTSYSSANGFTSNGVWDIGLDNQGDVWMATDEGGVNFDGSNWIFYNTTNSGLSDDVVISIEVSPNGVVWMGTRYGLYKFNGATWVEFTTANSELPNNFINTIAVSPAYLHYVGTQNGATVYVE